MEFLAPNFFYGLLALSIPIIIHLFNFRRTKRVYFSSNRFLKKISEQTSSRRTLKHLLILLSRLLFLFFLVVTFAQPYFPAEEGALQTNVQIYLDNSYSMSNETDVELPAFDQAVMYVRDILMLYPESAKFRLLTNDPDPFSNRFRSASEIEDKLTELQLSRFSRTSAQVYEKLTDDVAVSAESDIYWISDFQEVYNEPVETDTAFSVRVIPLAFTGTQNVYIDTMYLKQPLVKGSESSELVVRLSNTSETEIDNLITRVFINGNQVTSSSFDIPAGSYRDAVFDFAFSFGGKSTGSVSFEDFPVTFDNEMYFVLSTGKKMKVVEVKGENAGPHIKRVYGNNDLFDLSVQSARAPDYEEIRNANLVVLNEVEQVSSSLMGQLQRFMDNSGTLAVIPSTESDMDTYRSLTGLPLQKRDTSKLIPMQNPDYAHPFYESVFEDTRENISMPVATGNVFWGNDRNALLKMGNSDPFLSRYQRYRSGQLYIFASPMNETYTNFPMHALFVPVMYKMAMSSVISSEPMYHTLSGSQFFMEFDSLGEKDIIKLRREGMELIPSQRILGNEAFVELPSGDIQPGFYEVLVNDVPEKNLAFNYDKKESLLKQYQAKEVVDLFPGGKVEMLTVTGDTALKNVLAENYQLQELWMYTLILSILFLVVETLLFRFMH